MTLQINNALLREMQEHAGRAYPSECCGALLGRVASDGRRIVVTLHPVVNRVAGTQHNRYTVGPQDFLAVECAARSAGLELLGWYHSHPDHPAIPSEFDREHGWPWFSYVIVSVTRGRAALTASWRLDDDRVKFHQECLKVVAEPAAANERIHPSEQASAASRGKS